LFDINNNNININNNNSINNNNNNNEQLKYLEFLDDLEIKIKKIKNVIKRK
jgi:hypothetical protein